MAVAISMIVTVLEMLEGFRSTDPELIRMAETFGASRQQIFRKIVFPANIPVLFNSLKINIGFRWWESSPGNSWCPRRDWGTSLSMAGRCSSWIW